MKKSILFIITACFLFTSSCSDFLDEEHKTKYSSEYVFGTPEGLKLAVNHPFSDATICPPTRTLCDGRYPKRKLSIWEPKISRKM